MLQIVLTIGAFLSWPSKRQEDQYGTLAQIDEIEARIYSPLEVAISEQCGHAPHVEQPQKTLQVIVDYSNLRASGT